VDLLQEFTEWVHLNFVSSIETVMKTYMFFLMNLQLLSNPEFEFVYVTYKTVCLKHV